MAHRASQDMAAPVGMPKFIFEVTAAATDIRCHVSEGDHDREVVVDPTVMEVQEFLAESYNKTEIDIGGAVMVEGMSASVEYMQINLVMISRVDLHSELENQGFER